MYLLTALAGKALVLIALSKPGSQIVSFGATAGLVLNLEMSKLYRKQIDILGLAMGSHKDFADMIDFFGKHEIHQALDKTYPLEKVAEALKRLENGEGLWKIMPEPP